MSSAAEEIDAAGVIYGTATDAAGVVRRFSWAAVPEQSGVVVVAAGAAALLLRRRRRS